MFYSALSSVDAESFPFRGARLSSLARSLRRFISSSHPLLQDRDERLPPPHRNAKDWLPIDLGLVIERGRSMLIDHPSGEKLCCLILQKGTQGGELNLAGFWRLSCVSFKGGELSLPGFFSSFVHFHLKCTSQASLCSTLPSNSVTPLKGNSLSPRSCPPTLSAPSESYCANKTVKATWRRSTHVITKRVRPELKKEKKEKKERKKKRRVQSRSKPCLFYLWWRKQCGRLSQNCLMQFELEEGYRKPVLGVCLKWCNYHHHSPLSFSFTLKIVS